MNPTINKELMVQYNMLNNLYDNKEVEISLYDKDGNHIMTKAKSETCENCMDSSNCPKKAFNLLKNPLVPEGYLVDLEKKSKASIEKDLLYTQKDGRKKFRTLRLTTIKAKDYNDKPIGYILLTQEVTDEKNKERDFATSHNNLLLSLSLGKITAWKYDINNDETTLLSVNNNDKLEKIKRIYKSEDSLKHLHPEDRGKVVKLLGELIKGSCEKGELMVRFRLSGEKDYTMYRGLFCSLKDKYGKPYAIIGNQQDMTEITRHTNELKQAKDKLSIANAQMADALRMSRIIPFTLDKKTKKITAPQLINKSEYGYLDICNLDTDFEQIKKNIHPDDVAAVERLNDDIICDRKEKGWMKVRYDANRLFNRMQLLVLEHRSKLGNDDGTILGYLQEITEFEKMTQKLMEYKKKAEEINRLKSVLLTNVSHELRTPLNHIVGFSQLLAKSNDDDEKKEYAAIINESSESLQRLIDGMVKMSDLNVKRNKRQRNPFNLSDIFKMVHTHYLNQEWEFTNKNIEFILDNIPDEEIVNLDKIRTLECVDNFVSNAFKQTKEGKINIGFTINNNRDIFMYVKDTGCGISKDDKERIFEKFEKGNNFIPGIGLGLSICMRYVKEAGCNIGVESEPGKGSTFWINIPERCYQ